MRYNLVLIVEYCCRRDVLSRKPPANPRVALCITNKLLLVQVYYREKKQLLMKRISATSDSGETPKTHKKLQSFVETMQPLKTFN